ncbi:hypothetical protein QWJ26_24280 [Streptomyces sp. CSDS2]|uniref:hypothetical protein n=1 Tax=Streptomyces sp. CSDS2 TaxID=3055051 RepID=UPI0025B20A24|nr:hypothetical protein [Streptomyces sp. CSDS2]MDN3262866.1 hypothetical protein [Streptomyces sp. CSDS2]
MWDTFIGAGAALAGVGLASSTQLLADRRARAEQHRRQVAALVGALLKAVLAYRELYWLRVAAMRSAEPETAPDRAALYRARSAVTEAKDDLALVTDDATLIDAAETAVWSAIELSDIALGPVTEGRFSEAVETELAAGRERTRDTHTALRRAGAEYVHRI